MKGGWVKGSLSEGGWVKGGGLSEGGWVKGDWVAQGSWMDVCVCMDWRGPHQLPSIE